MIRMLVADDHRMFREGLCRLLSDHSDLQVVAQASSSAEALDAVRRGEIDVAILDLSMPGRSGTELIAHVKSIRPAIRVLVMTMHGDSHHVTQSLRAGADGYVTKEIAASELCAAIRRLYEGGRFLSASVAEQVALGIATQDTSDSRHSKLSDREYRIFEMLVEGKRGWEIAAELSLSEKTVSTHKVNVLKKMNFTNRAELIRYAIRQQLLAA